MAGLTPSSHIPEDTPEALKREILGLRSDVNYLRSLVKNSIIGGKVIEDIQVSTTAANIFHGMGKPWKGFVIIKKSGVCDVSEAAGAHDKREYIRLVSSASATINLLVF
jgi:hypothetical protein